MRAMRQIRQYAVMLLTLGVLSSVGCAGMSQTERGVALGGLTGGGLGAAIGNASGDTEAGALIGGLLGAGIGGIIGNDAEQRDRREQDQRQLEAQQSYWAAQPQRIETVISMVRHGHDENVIINQIQRDRLYFDLSVADLNYLRDQGVSPRVILAMQNSRPVARHVTPVRHTEFVHETVIVPRPVFVDPCPPNLIIAPRPRPKVGYVYRPRHHW